MLFDQTGHGFTCGLLFQGFKQQALAVSMDPEHRFELALQLGELKIAYQLAVEAEVSIQFLWFILSLEYE